MTAKFACLLADIETMANWKDDLRRRLSVAQLCFDTVGLSDERLAELTHEVRSFNRVCHALAGRIPGSLTQIEERAAA